MPQKILLGLAGFGTVGKGVYTVLNRNAPLIENRSGKTVEIKTIVCRKIEKARQQLPQNICVSDDLMSIALDPDISIAIEVIGGIEPAKTFILECLKHGKNVVTANKALIAAHGTEIFEAAQQYDRSVFFEAAVAGGIPVIKALREGLAANRIKKISGILNGTCNYILSSMHQLPVSFEDALKEAQHLGYAEADPTFDIEGMDTGHKLTILTSLAFGVPLHFDTHFISGITTVGAKDVKVIKNLGFVVKLLASAEIYNESIKYQVAPTLIPKESFLAKVSGAMNAVQIESDAVGTTLYYGAGAGGEPTASAVLADVVDLLKGHRSSLESTNKEALPFVAPVDMTECRFVRIETNNINNLTKSIQETFTRNGISLKLTTVEDNNTIVLTEKCQYKDLEKTLQEIKEFFNISDISTFNVDYLDS